MMPVVAEVTAEMVAAVAVVMAEVAAVAEMAVMMMVTVVAPAAVLHLREGFGRAGDLGRDHGGRRLSALRGGNEHRADHRQDDGEGPDEAGTGGGAHGGLLRNATRDRPSAGRGASAGERTIRRDGLKLFAEEIFIGAGIKPEPPPGAPMPRPCLVSGPPGGHNRAPRKDPVTEPVRPFSSPQQAQVLTALNERAREIFRQIVESYLTNGEPVGSRNLARILPMALSPASIRNVMADLEHSGLIYAPHASAGRLPTEQGLRFFVDGMLELGDVGRDEQVRIEAQMRAAASGHTFDSALAEASTLLSGISRGAGVVLTTKTNVHLKHIEFVRLDPARALVVLVSDDGSVENRLLDLPPGLPASALQEASNYLNARLQGRTLGTLRAEIESGRQAMKRELDAITERLVDAGLAVSVGPSDARQLIVRGQANLLDDLRAAEDLERIRLLFNDLETQKDVIELLSRAEGGEGVRIFIGSENKLFSLSGSSMIAAPFRDGAQKIVGVVGVIGPTRLNYARIVPMVDYTARVVSGLLDRNPR